MADTIDSIANVTIDFSTNSFGLEGSDILFNENSILLDLDGVSFEPGLETILNVEFGEVMDDDDDDNNRRPRRRRNTNSNSAAAGAAASSGNANAIAAAAIAAGAVAIAGVVGDDEETGGEGDELLTGL